MKRRKTIVHVRRIENGGGDTGKPLRTTFEVFYPAGKGRKHADNMRRKIQNFILDNPELSTPREKPSVDFVVSGEDRKE